MPKETDVYKSLAAHMNTKHPAIIYHFDLSGVHNPSKYSRVLYSMLNGRGWPDFFVAHPSMIGGSSGVYPGLFLEIKKSGERIRKRDGTFVDQHTAEQAATLDLLKIQGYAAEFAIGIDVCIELVETYLEGTLRI